MIKKLKICFLLLLLGVTGKAETLFCPIGDTIAPSGRSTRTTDSSINMSLRTLPPLMADLPAAKPVFIGYTEKNNGFASLPHLVHSMAEFESTYGGEGPLYFTRVVIDDHNNVLSADPLTSRFHLHGALDLYFKNGGVEAYVISVGGHDHMPMKQELLLGLEQAKGIPDVNLLAIPDAVTLPGNDMYIVQQAALSQAFSMDNAFVILDTRLPLNSNRVNVVAEFQGGLGSQGLSWGAAYAPWLGTNMPARALNLDAWANALERGGVHVSLSQLTKTPEALSLIKTLEKTDPKSPSYQRMGSELLRVAPELLPLVAGLGRVPYYVPPSGAICGAYVSNDAMKGVWKSPGNIQVKGVSGVSCMSSLAGSLGIRTVSGGAYTINSITNLPSSSLVIWGDRTLAPDTSEFKMISTRRSGTNICAAVRRYGRSWLRNYSAGDGWAQVVLRDEIRGYLNQKSDKGYLPSGWDKASYVKCGVGDTMTDYDIQAGNMVVLIGLALERPAEFIPFRIVLKAGR